MRLANNCVTSKDTQKSVRWIPLLQFGITTKNGTEGIVQAARHVFDSDLTDNTFGMPPIDLIKACSVISRARFMQRAKEQLSSLLPWMQLYYGGEVLFFWACEDTPQSGARLQRGEALWLLLFSITLRPLKWKILYSNGPNNPPPTPCTLMLCWMQSQI